jgi:ribosomal protein S18 acetylase RimI-like enzyme
VINNVRASNHRAISLYEALGAKAVPLSSSLCAFAISPP